MARALRLRFVLSGETGGIQMEVDTIDGFEAPLD